MSPAAISPDGIELRYDVAGAGSPAVVFVHGWSCDRTYWREQLTAFAGRHLVVALDLAGHGESGIGRPAWTMPAFGDDVVAVVDQLELERMILVGHSMGGDVVVEAALRLGDRVSGVVWVDTYQTLEDPSSAEELDAFVEPFRRDFSGPDPDVHPRPVPVDGGSGPGRVGGGGHGVGAARHRARRGGLRVGQRRPDPGCAATGSRCRSSRSTPTTGRRTSTPCAATRVSTVIVHGVGHFPMLEDPAQFNRVLDEVVATLGASSG